MNAQACLLAVCAAVAAAQNVKELPHAGAKPIQSIPKNPDTWIAILDDVCQRSQMARPYANDTMRFLQCVRHPRMEETNSDLGIWTVGECIEGTVFSITDGYCRPRSVVRRAQASVCASNPPACQAQVSYTVQQQQVVAQPCPCQQQPAPVATAAPQPSCMCAGPQVYQPQPVPQPMPVPQPQPQAQPCGCQQQQQCPCAPQVQPQPCPQAQGGAANAQPNGICSWMIDPLATNPGNPATFLQCQPAPYNVFCGRWRVMPCSIYTIFDASLQVCVNDPNAPVGQLPPVTQAPATAPPQQSCGCSTGQLIGSCGQNYQCPGMSQCQVTQPATTQSACGACCYFGAIFRR